MDTSPSAPKLNMSRDEQLRQILNDFIVDASWLSEATDSPNATLDIYTAAREMAVLAIKELYNDN